MSHVTQKTTHIIWPHSINPKQTIQGEIKISINIFNRKHMEQKRSILYISGLGSLSLSVSRSLPHSLLRERIVGKREETATHSSCTWIYSAINSIQYNMLAFMKLHNALASSCGKAGLQGPHGPLWPFHNFSLSVLHHYLLLISACLLVCFSRCLCLCTHV